MENILIIGAHYDDAELGAGGTAAKLADSGKKVYKITLTDNETNYTQMHIQVDAVSSKLQSKKACDVLGVTELDEFSPVACNYLEYNTETMQRIEKIIFKYDIDTVFTHFSSDFNQDHVAAARLSLTAARHCDNILQYHSNGYILPEVFKPTFFVDITNYVDKKREALGQYGTEHDRFNRLFSTNVERNHTWGYGNKVEYAEGFHIVKWLVR